MPVYLPAPAPATNHLGPDCQGRNRLRIEILDSLPQCALKPRTIRKLLLETYDTQHARFGGFAACDGHGHCDACALYASPKVLGFRADRLSIRIDGSGRPWIMNKLEDGWGSYGLRTSLTRLANAPDYAFLEGRQTRIQRDETSEYLWITKVAA